MTNLETVDAKIDRARLQLRRLRAVVADLCSERARLIVREEFENGERWVHRGGEPAMPVRWTIEVGKFVRNLRSALDHLVWQLAAAHGDCAGRHGGDTCPGRHNRFPLHDLSGARRFDKQLCGVNAVAREYIRSVQPHRQPPGVNRPDHGQVFPWSGHARRYQQPGQAPAPSDGQRQVERRMAEVGQPGVVAPDAEAGSARVSGPQDHQRGGGGEPRVATRRGAPHDLGSAGPAVPGIPVERLFGQAARP